MSPSPDTSSVLDNPIWWSLTGAGAHSHFAQQTELAARYVAEVAPFAALAQVNSAALGSLATLCGPGEVVAVMGLDRFDLTQVREDWRLQERLLVKQMVCERPLSSSVAVECVDLCGEDVAEMMALVELTEPGPFLTRTLELGCYLGRRGGGRLIAMGGERMQPPGTVELSAICTHPEFRGRGLAEHFVRVLGSRAQEKGLVPFLHVMDSNAGAIALYHKLGFRERGTRFISLLLRKSRAKG